ncbi:LytR/AlgR family response regulator transcription factor [Aquimarina pacifica]|uniref:LytR/AlgR family response regulator transcription factor n=1 Tax=Aquimarina pacifica TaxID=1296415 RepID=UPI00046F002B|nr:response regulator transcription factor [Aquimarina pacifica]
MTNQKEKINVFIVEDEILIAKDIANRLTDINYEVIGVAPSAIKALQGITTNPNIDIILIDIVLNGELDGIELAQIINKKYQIPFIFLTSHANTQFIERAKVTNPYGYILKPFNDRQVSIAMQLALSNFKNKNQKKNLYPSTEAKKVLQTGHPIEDSLFLKKNHHFERVPLKEIQFLKADDNYCIVHTKSEQFMYAMVLKKIEAHLPVHQFLRVHRSYVVNIELIRGFEGNMLFIGDRKIPVSKTYKSKVFDLFHSI